MPGPDAPAPDVTAGPFVSEAQARALAAVREAFADAHASDRGGVLAEHGTRMIADACAAAGVEPGAYGQRVIGWLAGVAEPHQCAVIADLITRAAKAGRP